MLDLHLACSHRWTPWVRKRCEERSKVCLCGHIRIFKNLSFKIFPRKIKCLSLQFAHLLQESLVSLMINTKIEFLREKMHSLFFVTF